ncbi:alpha/beta hydrolase [Pseudarthrobacter sulfonivorans]|uniref:alpha/beta hydrolase n=1 Tax=Pseudarthrobacter sulfonivorans TaxID=121292 RepID=UPI002105293F|nr:alpha/beta fold hydrolase [Pseudarthrobacter sulfonivorans]
MTDRSTEGSRTPPAGAPRTTRQPSLAVLEAAGPTRGVALLLHGGKAHSYEPVEARHLSPLRMLPFARHLHRAGKDYGLAVWSLQNSVRGWNGPDMSALRDARWALQQISAQHPGVPVYLVGHSMGGLTAVCAADDPQVEAVVALAPWLSPETPAQRVAGRKILIVHGTGDRMTSPAQSLKFARGAASTAASMQYVSLSGAGHFMIRRVRLWHTLATGFVMKSFAERTGFTYPDAGTLDRILPESATQVNL